MSHGYHPVARLALPAVLLVSLVSCAPHPTPSDPGFRVRLVTSAPLSGRWECEAERGLGLIAATLDADVARVRARGSSDQRSQLRELGNQGADLVFCVGPQAESLVYTEAGAFPETDFVVVPGQIHGPNIGSVAFMPEEVGYLAAVAAVAFSDGAAVGVLRGSGRRWLAQLENGFAAGVEAAQPQTESIVSTGPEGPWELAERGVRVALYASDIVDRQLIAAAHDAGIAIIATDPALMEAEPDTVIAAVRIDVAEAMVRIAREVRDHRFMGRVFAFDLGSGVLDVELNPEFDNASGFERTREALERARSEITAGWIEIEELGIGL